MSLCPFQLMSSPLKVETLFTPGVLIFVLLEERILNLSFLSVHPAPLTNDLSFWGPILYPQLLLLQGYLLEMPFLLFSTDLLSFFSPCQLPQPWH